MHKLNMFCYIRKTGLSHPPCSERNIPYQWDLTGINSASPLSRCVTTPAHRQARRAGLHESIQTALRGLESCRRALKMKPKLKEVMCDTHTPGHPSTAVEAWYWPVCVLHIG